jgi:hypothetical protein
MAPSVPSRLPGSARSPTSPSSTARPPRSAAHGGQQEFDRSGLDAPASTATIHAEPEAQR